MIPGCETRWCAAQEEYVGGHWRELFRQTWIRRKGEVIVVSHATFISAYPFVSWSACLFVCQFVSHLVGLWKIIRAFCVIVLRAFRLGRSTNLLWLATANTRRSPWMMTIIVIFQMGKQVRSLWNSHPFLCQGLSIQNYAHVNVNWLIMDVIW